MMMMANEVVHGVDFNTPEALNWINGREMEQRKHYTLGHRF